MLGLRTWSDLEDHEAALVRDDPGKRTRTETPRVSGRSFPRDRVAQIHVEIHAPLCGLVLSYEGEVWHVE